MWKQKSLPAGATIVPVILASDKTQLSTFSGDKQAWPVYLTIGNIEKSVRRQPSARANILLGYIPVTKLENIPKERRQVEIWQLFHDCVKIMLAPLAKAGKEGINIVCADGNIRHIFPILAAYVADYPEQCLISCCQENSCPTCIVGPKERGESMPSPLRDSANTLKLLAQQSHGKKPPGFKQHNLRAINPFWADLPHCNIHSCITPDILHQLHKGIFGDHVAKWAKEAAVHGMPDIDKRFKTIPVHPNIRQFKKGISHTTQWTGKEYKDMEKVFVGILEGAVDPDVVIAVRSIVDFIFYAHFETHTEESLCGLDEAWRTFHSKKMVFETLEIRTHFNISKLHNIRHYVDSIRSRGTTNGFNTETSERLHIDLAKSGYRASNHKNYIVQMTAWLARQESIYQFAMYLKWAVPKYMRRMESLGKPIHTEKVLGRYAKDGILNGEDADPVENEDPESDDETACNETNITYRIVKNPPYP